MYIFTLEYLLSLKNVFRYVTLCSISQVSCCKLENPFSNFTLTDIFSLPDFLSVVGERDVCGHENSNMFFN